MGLTGFQNPRTASLNQSVWRVTEENDFRAHIVALEACSNAVPISPQLFVAEGSSERVLVPPHNSRLLPLLAEQRLADDFAALVAVQEGAQSVSAVCLEEHRSPKGLTVRIAAIDAIDEHLRGALEEIARLLSQAGNSIGQDERDSFPGQLFDRIIRLHYARLLGRLRSTKWKKPKYLSRTHKKPLWQDFANLTHRAQFVYTKKDQALRKEVEIHIGKLADEYKAFDDLLSSETIVLDALKRLVKSSYDFCLCTSIRDYAYRLDAHPNPTAQISAASKCLHQVEKIAAYFRRADTLVQYARRYRDLFQALSLEFLAPYAAVSTEIAYESWAKTMHVHAEVQLVVFYDTQFTCLLSNDIRDSNKLDVEHTGLVGEPDTTQKRKEHDLPEPSMHQWHVANTHGRLYDQWTIPDTMASNTKYQPTSSPPTPETSTSHLAPVLELYRHIISSMDQTITQLTSEIHQTLSHTDHDNKNNNNNNNSKTKRGTGQGLDKHGQVRNIMYRVEPMTSRENLLVEDRYQQ